MDDSRPADGDWATAWTHYLLRASMRAARERELQEQALACVAQGRLSPAALRAVPDEGRLREQSARVAALHARWLADVAAITAIGAQPDGSGDAIAWAGAPMTDHLPRLARRWFALLDGLADAWGDLAEAHLSGILATVRPSGLDAPFAVELRAAPGETASALLSLANTRSEPAVVRCRVTDVRRADGVGPSFVPKVAVAPGILRLAGDEARDVRLSLRLEKEAFDPGASYLGAVRLARRGEPPVDVPLRIQAVAGGGPP